MAPCTRSRAATACGASASRPPAPTPAAGEHFGAAVAIDGDDAVVGAPGRDGDSRDQGGAFAFAYAAGGWTHSQTLTIPAGEEHNDAEFGQAVALDAGTLAVGAPRNPSPEGNQGLVYTFSGDDGDWAPRQTLIAQTRHAVRVSAPRSPSRAPRSSPARPTTTSRRGSGWPIPRRGRSPCGPSRGQRRRVHHRRGRAAARARPRRARQRLQPERRHGSTRQLASNPRTARLSSMSTARSVTSRWRTSVAPTRSGTTRRWARHRRIWRRSHHRPSAPTAAPDSYNTPQDTPLAVTASSGALANDTSGSGRPLNARLVGSPTHGTSA